MASEARLAPTNDRRAANRHRKYRAAAKAFQSWNENDWPLYSRTQATLPQEVFNIATRGRDTRYTLNPAGENEISQEDLVRISQAILSNLQIWYLRNERNPDIGIDDLSDVEEASSNGHQNSAPLMSEMTNA